MPNYEVQISPNVTVKFYSDKNMSTAEKSTAAIVSVLDYSLTSAIYSNTELTIAQKLYRIKYQIIVSRIINRATIYSEVIKYIRVRRGDFDGELADYAIEKLLEALDRT